MPLVLLNRDGVPAEELKSLERELAIAFTTEGPRLPDSPQIREMSGLILALLDKAIARRPDDLAARGAKARALARPLGAPFGGDWGHPVRPGDGSRGREGARSVPVVRGG